jgi:hypothetical protein
MTVNQEEAKAMHIQDMEFVKFNKVKDFLFNKFNIHENIISIRAREICEFDDVYNNFQDFMEKGQYDKSSAEIYGFRAYDLVNPPINFSELGAICALYEIRKYGIFSDAYKFCYTTFVNNSIDKERERIRLDMKRELFERELRLAAENIIS